MLLALFFWEADYSNDSTHQGVLKPTATTAVVPVPRALWRNYSNEMPELLATVGTERSQTQDI